MQKIMKKKLVLSKVTVRTLVAKDLARVAGGISREDCHSIQRGCGIKTGGFCDLSDDCTSGPQIRSCACA